MPRAWPVHLLALGLVVAACGVASSTTGTDDPSSGALPASRTPSSPSTSAPASPIPSPVEQGDGLAYECGPIALSPAELDAAPPATELGPDGAAALQGVEVPPIEPADGWRILGEGPDELALIRELDQPIENGPGDVRTHEFLSASWLTEVNDGPGWYLNAFGDCALRRELLGDLETADLVLDPEHPLDPKATSVQLWAFERSCASGEAATGRLQVVSQLLTSDELQLHVGIRPLGEANCPSNPPTSFTVELGERLGDRVPVDIAILPPRPLTTPTEDLG